MPSPSTISSETASSAGADAIVSATNSARALELARVTDTASLFSKIEESLSKQNESNLKALKLAVVDVVHDALGTEPTRYFDASRIPLICKSIFKLELYMKLVMWIVGITGGAFIVNLVAKFFKAV